MTEPLRIIGEAFDARAPHYDESAMHRDVAAAVAGFVALDDVSRVVDMATGTGLVLRALSGRATGVDLIGVDISPGMLGIAREALPTAEWIEADAAALPLPDSSADLVTCVTALHIIPSVAQAAVEWKRVLRPGGRLVTATFAGPVPRAPVPPHGASDAPYRRDHEPYADPETLATTFGRLGFRLTRHTEWSDDIDTVLIAELVTASAPDEPVDAASAP
ncbi:MAG: Methyltransferase type 11 [Microbacterium sp.]|uniref:class I SAM-dependent methyltransferase n=1 Tax=Microbacterium sp. TaxID=51671 RepID=UPI002625D83B|nr:methyltransferase domain-containing protein [Microbacterium sp.]MDF2559895.1 Methyltransferase type 11 [Microbacterium sp.]